MDEKLRDVFNFVMFVFGVQVSLMLIWNDPTPEAIAAGAIVVPFEVLYIVWLLTKQDWVSWRMELWREISTVVRGKKSERRLQ